MKLLPNIPFKIVALIVISLIVTASWLVIRERIKYNKLQEQKRIELLEKDAIIHGIITDHAAASIRVIDREIRLQDSLSRMVVKLEASRQMYLKTARELAKKAQENENIREDINDVLGSDFQTKSEFFSRTISQSLIR